ncbi:MAG: hypothetical protein M1828_006668 [Chrysothrix sp. TS-e1954]|nr:MAG: hypothetical protein M1828_006668 [Chrysothrix sp. TS-e1954]
MTTYSQVDGATYARPLDAHERLYAQYGDCEPSTDRHHWALTGVFTVRFITQRGIDASGQFVASRLRHAWAATRFRYPDVATTTTSTHKLYVIPDAASLESWLNETFVISPDENATTFIPSIRRNRYMMLYYLPASRELVLHSHHGRIDSLGIFQVLNHVVSAAITVVSPSSFHWGREVQGLHNGLEAEAGSVIAAHEAAPKDMQAWAEALPSIGLPCHASPSEPPGLTSTCTLSFSEEETRNIIQSAREQSLTLSAMTMASVFAVQYEFAEPEQKKRPYSGLIPVNYRTRLQRSARLATDDAQAGSVVLDRHVACEASSGYALVIPPGIPWLAIASHVQSVLRQVRDPPVVATLAARGQALLDVLTRTDLPPATDALLSSLGMVDRYVHSSHKAPRLEEVDSQSAGPKQETDAILLEADVERVWMGIELLQRQVSVFLWTFRGIITMSCIWNESFYRRVYMESFLQRVRQVILSRDSLASNQFTA